MQIITDIHIKTIKDRNNDLTLDLAASLIFPGVLTPTNADFELFTDLLSLCKETSCNDFMIQHRSVYYRGRRDAHAIDGTWFRLRRMADEPPDIDKLPSPIPSPIKAALMSSDLCQGGLIYVTGGPGCGKTTTASALVVSRLKAFGGIAYTLEDPPELPLNGRHGTGYCTQTMVSGNRSSDWAESLRGILRSQPVGTNLILFVGEVRDAETAQAMIRAASNGFLVICTSFASDLISAIDNFYQLLGAEYAATLAASIRCILYQRVLGEKFIIELLTSENASSRVATIIRGRNISQLKDEIMYQRNAMISGQSLFKSK